MQVKHNNSAGRLQTILNAMRDSNPSNSSKMFDVYVDVFESCSTEPFAKNVRLNNSVLSIQMELNDLVKQVMNEAESLTASDPDYVLFNNSLTTLPRLAACFSPTSDKNSLVTSYNEATEMALFTFSQAFAKEPDIEASFVDRIRSLIDEPMAEIELSDLPRSIKEFLFNMQSTSRSMLDRYRISGTRGLKGEFHKILGEFADVYRKDPAKEKHASIWERSKSWLFSFDSLIASAEKYPTIAENSANAVDAVTKLLE